MSSTPRTDAAIRAAEDAGSWEDTAVQIARISQSLERDLATAQASDARKTREINVLVAENRKLIGQISEFRRDLDAAQASITELESERDALRRLPHIETVAANVHAAWMQVKRAAGINSRQAEDGEELMVPYAELSDKQQEMDRLLVRQVYAAIAAAQEGK